MKKFISLLLILSLIFCFVGCSNNKSNDNNGSNLNEQTENSNLNEQLQTNSTEELVAEGEDFFFWEEVEGGIGIIGFDPGYDEDGNIKKYTKVIIPEMIEGKPVVGFGRTEGSRCVFASAPNVKEVVIPKTVKFIGKQAFYQAFELEKITGGEGIIEIHEMAFISCKKLKLPSFLNSAKIEYIGLNAFGACESFNGEIELPYAKKIESGAFGMCSGGITLIASKGSAVEDYYNNNFGEFEEANIDFELK